MSNAGKTSAQLQRRITELETDRQRILDEAQESDLRRQQQISNQAAIITRLQNRINELEDKPKRTPKTW